MSPLLLHTSVLVVATSLLYSGLGMNTYAGRGLTTAADPDVLGQEQVLLLLLLLANPRE